ncbi:MAG: NFACT family protein, partial [Lawsonibacter sp.]|nr:NFACT family protein [Lawsonibacter sp.]
MPLDALCLSGLVNELQNALVGAKIDKIHQPGRDEVIMALRSATGNVKLLLSASPSHPRPQLTELARENPDVPPMFCMRLRKHLTGGRIMEITQPPLERVVEFRIEALDELGDRVERRLVLEAMGRHSNLILLDGDGRIMDCLRRVDGDMSAKRQVLPGLFYHLPPTQEKLDPTTLDRDAIVQMAERAFGETRADQWLLDTFGGFSPLICRELAQRAGGAVNISLSDLGQAGQVRLADQVEQLLFSVKKKSFTPLLITIEKRPKDFTFLPVIQYGEAAELTAYPTFSALLDRFYEQRENLERVKQKGQDLIRSVTNTRDRTARKLGNQQKELAATRERERLRQFGDLVTANLSAIERGM